jgi:hypothetical protein
MRGVRLSTTRSAAALLGRYDPSPAKLAATAPGYVPALMPASVTLPRNANPLGSVVAVPTGCPFNAKLTVRPASGAPADVNDAMSVVVPPKVPVAGKTPTCDPETSGRTLSFTRNTVPAPCGPPYCVVPYR